MVHRQRTIAGLIFALVTIAILAAGCEQQPVVVMDEPTPGPTAVQDLPEIASMVLDKDEVGRYESVELQLSVDAEYSNPYDARQVRLEAIFTAPDDSEMVVPGFWDGEGAWRLRFTPSQEGVWRYQLVVSDRRGASHAAQGSFTVTPSDRHGWLQPGNRVNPDYSGHYLVYHDGTPFYGIGHADALNILVDGFDADDGVGLFDEMQKANENFVVWWPLYTNSPINKSYDDYSVANMELIDLVVQDAQKENIFLIFTIWDHPQLRDQGHPWDTGRWTNNGFSKLGDLSSFFTSEEAWAWQENFYRYMIARWGYSPAIGMWQTVSEIDGTNAYDQMDQWHSRVNAYFAENDPYRHPTTASMSGDKDWLAGHAVMDVPQVHIYALEDDAVKAAAILANWTELMWQRAEKPNWVGEFGVGGNTYYPELFHNAIWAALATGAAMTPAEWNSSGFWGRMTPEMKADISRLAQFVEGMPLAAWNPSTLSIHSNDPEVRGWGLAGEKGGLFWVQDFSAEGTSIQQVRALKITRQDVQVTLETVAAGTYTLRPYDTWEGVYVEPFDITCEDGKPCVVTLPAFQQDMAFKIERK